MEDKNTFTVLILTLDLLGGLGRLIDYPTLTLVLS